MEVSKSDLQKVIVYLNDAAKLYEAVALAKAQAANCRAHMIKQLTIKLKSKLDNDKTRHH